MTWMVGSGFLLDLCYLLEFPVVSSFNLIWAFLLLLLLHVGVV